ncbi:MAG: MFS transporter [Rhodospirillales bacterium]
MEPSADSRRVLLLLNLGHALDHMGILIFPTAVLAMGDAFDRSYGELLTLSLGGFIAFGAGSLPAGWLGDRWSRRNMMVAFFFGMALAATLIGVADSAGMLAAGLTLLGLFAAIYHPVGIAMLVAHAGKLGREIGINGVCGNLGVAAAPLLTAAMAATLGWRSAFFLFAAVSALGGVFFLACVRDQRTVGTTRRGGDFIVPRPAFLRAVVVMILVSIAGGVVFNATTVAMPKVFDERLAGLHLDAFVVGALVSAVFAFGAMAQLIVGWLVDRMPLKRVFVPLSLLQAPCLLLAVGAGGWSMVALAALAMFAIFGQMTINDSIVARYTSDAWRARAFAARYLITFAASATAVPLVAFLHDGSGDFRTTFMVLGGLGAIVFLASLVFPAGRPERRVDLGSAPLPPTLRPQAAE